VWRERTPRARAGQGIRRRWHRAPREEPLDEAGWSSLRRHIKTNYKIAEDGSDSIKLVFAVNATRTQAVRISKIGDTGWAEISTAVCREGEISAREALQRNAAMVVGGLALHGSGVVIFRQSFPLANLDPHGVQAPLLMAVDVGDRLERELSGGGDLW
jgi:hypothetical protein